MRYAQRKKPRDPRVLPTIILCAEVVVLVPLVAWLVNIW